MGEPARRYDNVPEPDVSHLVTEDDTPVDSPFQDRQTRQMTRSLHSSWPFPGRPFVAYTDVGLRAHAEKRALVPDMLLSLDVTNPKGDPRQKKNRSYFCWQFGKAPDAIVEVVSGRRGGEERKLKRYAAVGVKYAILFDPQGYLSPHKVRVYDLQAGAVDASRPLKTLSQPGRVIQLPDLGLGLRLWRGTFEDEKALWLRWCDADGRMLLTGEEMAQRDRMLANGALLRASSETIRADEEKARADEAIARAERLAARLRALGVDEI